jgi:acyl-CoA thioesterase
VASFFDETAVTPVGPATYEATIPEAWNLRPLPQGGFVTAIALRAMGATLGHPEQTLRTLHTAYIAQVGDGPVTVTVEELRRGRSMSHLRAETTGPDQQRGHATTAAFGSSRRGFTFSDLSPPTAVTAPGECRSFRDPLPAGVTPLPPMPFWTERVEGRVVSGHPPWESYVPAGAERVLWYRFDDPPFRPDGTMDPLALVVLADTMPGAVDERLGPGRRNWFAPSIDLTVHLLDECRSPWVLAHNRARWAGDGYASADMALWDCGPDGSGQPRLVAYATQMFLFTFLD